MKIVFVGNFRVDFSTETHHAASLETLGHQVIRLQETIATSEEILEKALSSDMLVFVHTHGWNTPGDISLGEVFSILKEKKIPSVTYHLDLWFGLERQKDLDNDDFYKEIEYFFTVDKLMADWFNNETSVKGIYLPAAVFHKEVERVPVNPTKNEIVFVGSRNYHTEWPYRKELIDWLATSYRGKFLHVGNGSKAGHVRGRSLNKLYSASKIAVGDTLCLNFDYPYYWSDRVYETIGRGGFIIHPYIKGMEDHFIDGEHLAFYRYNDFSDLRKKINYYLSNDAERERIRMNGFNHVKENHTYLNRWQFIINEVFND